MLQEPYSVDSIVVRQLFEDWRPPSFLFFPFAVIENLFTFLTV